LANCFNLPGRSDFGTLRGMRGGICIHENEVDARKGAMFN
jgi:hypothetical protein